MTMRIMLAVALLALPGAPMSLLAQPPDTAAPANLVVNGDFSRATASRPDDWTASGSKTDVAQVLSVEKDADGPGKPGFARLVCTRCDRRGGDSHAMLVQYGQIKLVKSRPYEFTCRMRATGLRSRTVGVAIQETNGWLPSGLSDNVSLGAAWKRYRILFRAERDIGSTGRLQIWFSEPGTLDVADVRIVEATLLATQPEEFTDIVSPGNGRNLVFNGSFELGGAGWASMGTGAGWGDLSGLHGTIETSGGSQGKSFLRIPLGDGRTPVLYFDYFEPVARPQLRPLAASLGWIKVEKGQSYVLSAGLRASVDGTRAVLGARAADPSAGGWNSHDQPLKLTTAWKRYSVTFRPQRSYVFVYGGPDLAKDERVDVDIDAVQLEKSDKATGFQPHGDLEFAIEPTQPGGIFVENESAILMLRLCNNTATAMKTTVRFSATDFADQPVALPDQTVELGAGVATSQPVRLPADWKGYYRIHATANIDGKVASTDVRIAIVPPPVKDSVCGINHAFVSADLIRLASKAGVTWYRDWSLKWQHMEPAKGEYHWELADAQIDRVLREKANLMALLPPFPATDWNSEAPDSVKVGNNYPANRARQAFAPRDSKDLGGFTELAVARYKDRVHVWEFLNEPIYTSYALPANRDRTFTGKRYSPADYVTLLEVAAAGMKKADPPCKVMGGIAGGPETLTREVIEAGCLKHIDIFNLHIYPGQRTPESYMGDMDDLLARMDKNGGRKPIWMTEFSYYGADNLPRKPFFPRASSWSEARLLDSERQCADYTVRFFLVMLSHGVEKIFIHSGASGRVNDPNFECALFDYGGVPRKLFPAIAVLAGLLGSQPTCVGQLSLGEGGLGHAVGFETAKAAVVAAWTEGDEPGDRVALPAGNGVVLLDVVGRRLTGQAVNLSASPIYLVGPPGKATDLLAALKVAK